MDTQELNRLIEKVGTLRGWDWSRLKDDRDPVPYFITQQVGGQNTQNVFDVFGWGSNGEYWRRFFAERGMVFHDCGELRAIFLLAGCALIAHAEYNVNYYFQDIESLICWLKWSPLPEELDAERHHGHVTRLIETYQTQRGIATNEHRELLIVRKN